MSIRKTLLIALVCAGLAPAILLAGLAFVKTRDALRSEIEKHLAVQAAGIAADVDKMMFERLQNAATWSRLDVMQDMQVRDLDKRLSHFLADLKGGYRDVYLDLSAVDTQGIVVSSSDAENIGRRASSSSTWIKAPDDGGVELELPTTAATPGLVMRIPVASAFTSGSLGELRMRLNWGQLYEMLDRESGNDERMVVVLDQTGRIVAASGALRSRGLILSDVLKDWRTLPGPVSVRDGSPLGDAEVIVGIAVAKGYGPFPGFGWTTLIIQPVDAAFAPVRHMAMIFLALFALIIVVTVVVAIGISREIARPILALTRFARGYTRNKVLQTPPAAGSGEVGELTTAFVQMVRDIDLSQQNLVRASKLAVVGEMSSIIAHEVRTPLGILRSSAQMLKREAGISSEGQELVGFIESETERLNRLVSAMLDTARPRSPSFADTDMHALIGKTVAMLAAQADKRGVQVAEQLSATQPTVECDEEQMTQVLLNLLMNGLQILSRGGHIEISTGGDEKEFRIEIADDGPGIDPAERSRVFEAFFFKREGGVGLGLAIVQQIVQSHGGEIEAAESKLGGALFRIRLPRKQAEKP